MGVEPKIGGKLNPQIIRSMKLFKYLLRNVNIIFSHFTTIWMFPKIGGKLPPKWMVKIMENPIFQWMIWEYHYFFGNTHMAPTYQHTGEEKTWETWWKSTIFFDKRDGFRFRSIQKWLFKTSCLLTGKKSSTWSYLESVEKSPQICGTQKDPQKENRMWLKSQSIDRGNSNFSCGNL